MNMKVLIQTLTQIPDPELLSQLSQSIHTHKQLMIPSPTLFYKMLQTLFSCNSKQIKHSGIELYRFTFSFLLKTEVEQSWSVTSTSLIRMLGEQDAEIRKKSKQFIFEIIQCTNNANIVLEKLYYQGLEDQSVLVYIMATKTIYSVLQMYPNILHNKTSIRVVKLIIEKMIATAMSSKHIQLEKASKQFLEKLFYLKIQKLDEVLTLMNPKVLEYLQQLWAKNKQKMLEREKVEDEIQLKKMMEIKYEHLPLINGKFFAIYEPYVLKNLFNPEFQAGKVMAITQFRNIFQSEFEHLQKYLNVIFKVVIKFLDGYYDLLMMLKKIVFTPGVNNIVNLTVLPQLLVTQLSTQNVPYRRQLRSIMQKLNFEVSKHSLRAYEQQLKNTQINWIGMYEIVCLCEHWVDNNMENSYPPTLSNILQTLCHNMNSQQAKVKEKSVDVLLTILDRYPGYRQNLQDHFPQQKINEIEDAIEKRKNKGRGNSVSQQAEQIFMRQYNEERERFMKYQKEQKKTKK